MPPWMMALAPKALRRAAPRPRSSPRCRTYPVPGQARRQWRRLPVRSHQAAGPAGAGGTTTRASDSVSAPSSALQATHSQEQAKHRHAGVQDNVPRVDQAKAERLLEVQRHTEEVDETVKRPAGVGIDAPEPLDDKQQAQR